MFRKFESKCQYCEGRITTSDSGHTWRHDAGQRSDTTKHPGGRKYHPASPHGTMIQI